MTVNVLNGYALESDQQRRLEQAADGIRVVHHPIDDQAAIDAIDGSDIEVLLSDFLPTDLGRWPRLRWLQYSGAGVDELEDRAPWASGLLVTTASGGNAVAIGEYVLAWLLHLSQQVGDLVENQRARAWSATRMGLGGHGLRGRTLVIVGYGSVGREVARLARAFGVRVLAIKARPDVRADGGFRWADTGDPDGVLPERIVGLDQAAEVLDRADYVLVAAPLTPATRGILGRTILDAMSRNAWLINVGRGGLFDEEELIGALRERRIGGAVLDVAWREPLEASNALWSMPNVIVTPHVAGLSPTTWNALADLFAQNLARYVTGEPLLNLVDPDHGY